ncbi:type II CAAX endopeptidase family protein [Patulibacter sp. NPDC049589]|uniref:CPBP family intramembrane glutamic endopeptidase n=1 Tax=Patulibacter sp. NPDC049589 TaxID=3154731 RepID=UPI00342CA4FF
MTTPVSTTTSSPPAPDRGAAGPTPRMSWGAPAAFLAFIATFGAAIFTSIPTLAIGDDTNTAKATGSVIGSILQNAAFVGVPLLIVGMLVGGLRRRDVGLLMPPRAWRIPLFVVAALVLYLLISAGLGALLNADGQEDSLPEDLGAKGSLVAGIAVGLAVTVCAPIGEEFLMRGILYPGLRDSIARFAPAWVAVALGALIDGILFGALHIGGSKAIFLPILATFGIILCLLYQVTGSLYANILLHCTNNTIAIAVALDWSVLGGLALWAGAVSILGLIALIAKRVEDRLPPPRARPGLGLGVPPPA